MHMCHHLRCKVQHNTSAAMAASQTYNIGSVLKQLCTTNRASWPKASYAAMRASTETRVLSVFLGDCVNTASLPSFSSGLPGCAIAPAGGSPDGGCTPSADCLGASASVVSIAAMTAILLPRVLHGVLAPGACNWSRTTAVLERDSFISSRLQLDEACAIVPGSCTISAHKVLSMHQFDHEQTGSPINASPPEAISLVWSFASGTAAALPGSAILAHLRTGILCFAAEL